MQSQVIVPLDGSASAEAILPHALLFAQRGQSILTLLQIGTPSGLPGVRDRMIPDNWSEGEEIWGQDYLAAMVRRLQSSGVTIQTRHPEAALAEQAIVSYTKHQPQVQLIALTTQGRSAAGRALFGSLAEQVFASVSTSLLLLHPPKGEQTGSGPIVSASYQTIIVLLDGSVEAERALHEATSLAQEFSATPVLVAVPPRPGEEIFVSEGEQPVSDSPEEKAQLLRTTTGLRVETAATARDPEAFIEQLTGHGQGNLLVVATREQALYGAEKFLRHRNVPVLLLATYT
ncbi:MAG: universal stress protein [Chloroflexi bacterium]|nr:MAG: universal stress protein [Chloroflexota bacterium]